MSLAAVGLIRIFRRRFFRLTHEGIADAFNPCHGIRNLMLRQQPPQRHDVLVERMSFLGASGFIPERGAQRLVRHQKSHVFLQTEQDRALLRSSQDSMLVVENDGNAC